MDAVAAFRVLSGEDEACAAYVERFGSEAALAAEKQRAAAVSSAPTAKAAAAVTNLDDAIIRGLKADAARLAKEALATENELSLVEKHLIPALDKVGTDYERGVAFLPQLLGAAQAAQAVFSVIRDSLAAKGGEPVKKGRIVIATVKGDIHDIGKNIVRTVLENYGYDVLDLGRDVPPETVVDAVVKENIRLVGLSALMTTTLPSMEETVRQLHTLPNPPSIMVGGAVVTPEYAQNMGAFYAKDARASVEIAKKYWGKGEFAHAYPADGGYSRQFRRASGDSFDPGGAVLRARHFPWRSGEFWPGKPQSRRNPAFTRRDDAHGQSRGAAAASG